MSSLYDIVSPHVQAALKAGAAASYPPDAVASTLLGDAIRLLKQHRPLADLRSELQFAIENLEDRDYEFMRP
jgi:hypothetical protein